MNKLSKQDVIEKGLDEIDLSNVDSSRLVVMGVDSVEYKDLFSNIVENIDLLEEDEWVKTCNFTDETALLVSAGDSWTNVIDDYRQDIGPVLCVKHSLPKLMEEGIIPDFCVVLDPREINEESTHGIVRKELFKDASKETIFLVATSSNPEYIKMLKERGHTVYGFHVYSDEIFYLANKGVIKNRDSIILHGTSSAIRSISIAEKLGFGKINLYGFDSSFPNLTKKEKMEVREDGGAMYEAAYVSGEGEKKVHWTTLELAAQNQDLTEIFKKNPYKARLTMKSSGLSQDTYEKIMKERENNLPYYYNKFVPKEK